MLFRSSGTYEGLVVAIKRLRVYVAAPESVKIKLRREFCRESMLWKTLAHRHVLPFLGVAEDVFKNPAICMVLPWMTNGSIRHHVDRLRRNEQLVDEEFAECIDEWVCYQLSLVSSSDECYRYSKLGSALRIFIKKGSSMVIYMGYVTNISVAPSTCSSCCLGKHSHRGR